VTMETVVRLVQSLMLMSDRLQDLGWLPDHLALLVGYDAGDLLDPFKMPDVDVKRMRKTRNKFDPEIMDLINTRKPQARQLACGVNFVLPKPNQSFTNADRALRTRIGRATPRIDKQEFRRFRSFVMKHVKTKLKRKFDPLVIFSVDELEYIKNLNQPEYRKSQMANAYSFCHPQKIDKHHEIRCFIKEEYYPEIKNPRLIMPRDDSFKVALGRFIKKIEDVIFSKANFIKKIPSYKRPEFLLERLGLLNVKYIETDYTSWEASMGKLMQGLEHDIYKSLIAFCPEFTVFENLLKQVIQENVLKLGFCTYLVSGRASGEVTTSLGNTLLNYYIWKYVCYRMKIKSRSVFEGDDGLASVPIDFDVDRAVAIMNRLGMIVKMFLADHIGDVSFCGCRFDTIDMVNTTDPIRYLGKFGWSSRQYCSSNPRTRMELLKLKALSTIAAYPGCPILHKFASWIINETGFITQADLEKRLEKTQMTVWDRQRQLDCMCRYSELEQLINQPILESTRLFVQEKYDITIEQQLTFEEMCQGELRILDGSVLNPPLLYLELYHRNVVTQRSMCDLPW